MFVSAPSNIALRGLAICLVAGLCGSSALYAEDGVSKKESPDGDKQETQAITYLGLITSPVRPSLSSHLGLGEGVGLVVEYVDEEGAVNQVLEQHDVLHKFDDQLLVNPDQLSVLVRAKKPGDKVEFAVIRQGEKMTVEVTLQERQVPRWLADRAVRFGNMATRYEQWMPRIRNQLESMQNSDAVKETEQTMQKFIDEMKKRMEAMQLEAGTFDKLVEQMKSAVSNTSGRVEIKMDGGSPSTEFSSSFQSGSTSIMTMIDGDQRITVRGKDGDRHIKAFDHDGALLYEGPVNTDNERAALPENVRTLLERLEAAHEHTQPHVVVPEPGPESDDNTSDQHPIY